MLRIMHGFGCRLLAYDVKEDPALVAGISAGYVTLKELAESDVISLHVPLTPDTRHSIDAQGLAMLKPGVMLIDTGRGALIDI